MERTLGSMVRLARGDQFRAVFGVFFVLVGAPAGAQSFGASEEGAIQGEEACMAAAKADERWTAATEREINDGERFFITIRWAPLQVSEV